MTNDEQGFVFVGFRFVCGLVEPGDDDGAQAGNTNQTLNCLKCSRMMSHNTEKRVQGEFEISIS